MIKPSIGRVVWYHPTANDPGARGDQPYAAMVVRVASDRQVNLVVFTDEGIAFPRRFVPLAQDDDPVTQGMAQWMPFQVGQAAKADKTDTLTPRIENLEAVVTGLHEAQPETSNAVIAGTLAPRIEKIEGALDEWARWFQRYAPIITQLQASAAAPVSNVAVVNGTVGTAPVALTGGEPQATFVEKVEQFLGLDGKPADPAIPNSSASS